MEFDRNWNVGQLILVTEDACFSTIYVGQVSNVYPNRMIIIFVSESKPLLPRIRKVMNRVWESVIRDYDVEEGVVIIKPFPIKDSIVEIFDANTDTSVR